MARERKIMFGRTKRATLCGEASNFTRSVVVLCAMKASAKALTKGKQYSNQRYERRSVVLFASGPPKNKRSKNKERRHEIGFGSNLFNVGAHKTIALLSST
jgi:hypothetical protein